MVEVVVLTNVVVTVEVMVEGRSVTVEAGKRIVAVTVMGGGGGGRGPGGAG